MIRYALQCGLGHGFEGWFGRSADYDDQLARGLLSCPECGSAAVEKAIMAPSVRRAKTDKATETRAAIASAIRQEITANCDDVGERFAKEARAMHDGTRKPRGIYGRATPEEARALVEDGVPAVPLPPALDPKRAKPNLN